MRFFRRRSEFVVLALLALAAQFMLTSGHSHEGHAVDRTAALQCRAFVPPAADQPCQPHHDDGSGCSICWMISVAGTAVSAVPAVLAVAIPQGGIPMPIPEPLSLPRDAVAAFHARGPPPANLA